MSYVVAHAAENETFSKAGSAVADDDHVVLALGGHLDDHFSRSPFSQLRVGRDTRLR